MSDSRFNLDQVGGERILPEYYEHPVEGYLAYDPNTLYIHANRDGQKPVSHPIVMTGKFFGTKQPFVPTCSEPGNGNVGCSKWYGCPMKKYMHVGPGNCIIRKHGTVSMAVCYDVFETTRGGKPTSQMHLLMDGWKLDTSRTTIDVLGRTHAVDSGKLNENSSRQEVMAVKPRKWEMVIGGLLAPWWPLVKKKGEVLHPSAEHYPELTEEESEGTSKRVGRRSRRSA